jgi:hypothetical protein
MADGRWLDASFYYIQGAGAYMGQERSAYIKKGVMLKKVGMHSPKRGAYKTWRGAHGSLKCMHGSLKGAHKVGGGQMGLIGTQT